MLWVLLHKASYKASAQQSIFQKHPSSMFSSEQQVYEVDEAENDWPRASQQASHGRFEPGPLEV